MVGVITLMYNILAVYWIVASHNRAEDGYWQLDIHVKKLSVG